mmetsp:Transcript_9007/g.26501  ORF Transcript_9007/g.26501 Transcript_9007/m.26501 type:complete len:294 (-) Transcript_9007:471-1352(-)
MLGKLCYGFFRRQQLQRSLSKSVNVAWLGNMYFRGKVRRRVDIRPASPSCGSEVNDVDVDAIAQDSVWGLEITVRVAHPVDLGKPLCQLPDNGSASIRLLIQHINRRRSGMPPFPQPLCVLGDGLLAAVLEFNPAGGTLVVDACGKAGTLDQHLPISAAERRHRVSQPLICRHLLSVAVTEIAVAGHEQRTHNHNDGNSNPPFCTCGQVAACGPRVVLTGRHGVEHQPCAGGVGGVGGQGVRARPLCPARCPANARTCLSPPRGCAQSHPVGPDAEEIAGIFRQGLHGGALFP